MHYVIIIFYACARNMLTVLEFEFLNLYSKNALKAN